MFRSAIQGSDGIRQTVLCFATMAKAEAWIDHDRRPSAADGAWKPTGSRLPTAL
jgi:hypothetical protein